MILNMILIANECFICFYHRVLLFNKHYEIIFIVKHFERLPYGVTEGRGYQQSPQPCFISPSPSYPQGILRIYDAHLFEIGNFSLQLDNNSNLS